MKNANAKTGTPSKTGDRKRRRAHKSLAVPLVIFLLAAAGAAAYFFWPRGPESYARIVHNVRKRNLVISVLEGGNLHTTNLLEVASEVEGRATIISIVPDGTIITDEDVKNGKVLVELDSATLREKAAQQEITFQNAQADYTQAKESYDIQNNQNESNIQAGKLKVKFARMDLEKYLGATLADKVLRAEVDLAELRLGKLPTAEALKRLDDLEIGGTALQRKRELEANITLSGEEVVRAKDKHKWSVELGPTEDGGKGYISGSEVKADELALTRRELDEKQAGLAQDIFLRYELPKEAEKLCSDHAEAERELERIKAKARAELAQAEARLKSKQATFNLQKERLEKLQKQIVKCIIRAKKPGMVVYASTTDFRGRAQDIIEEGTEVRERQLIFTIPDPSSTSVKVQVHESAINKVRVGQKARIFLDAYPGKELTGRVTKVGRLPERQRWMSPDLKVYSTIVSIDNPLPNLKPGMSASAEILVDEIKDVVAVPVQAVSLRGGRRVCYVESGDRIEARPVKTGQSNDNFIHIVSGLEPGEHILLHVPDEALVASVPSAAAPAQAEPGGETEMVPPVSSGPKEEKPGSPEGPVAQKDIAATPEKDDDSEEDLGAAFQQMLEKAPAQMRERMKKRWESLTEEKRKDWLKRTREGGGRMRREGGQRGGRDGERGRRPRSPE